jgi:hypothetical protein
MLCYFLKLLLILNLIANFTESKPNAKECFENSDCAPGFSCMNAKKYPKRICVNRKDHHNSDYSIVDVDTNSIQTNHQPEGKIHFPSTRPVTEIVILSKIFYENLDGKLI